MHWFLLMIWYLGQQDTLDKSNSGFFCNRHKSKHALKYQAVTIPDGQVVHVSGQIEGCRHD